MKTIFTFVLFLFFSMSNAQFLDKLVKKAQKASERAIEHKVEQKASKTTIESVDGVLNNDKKTTSNTNGESIIFIYCTNFGTPVKCNFKFYA